MKKTFVKKAVAIVLTLVMLLSFAACGGGEKAGEEKTKLYVVNWKDYGSDDPAFIEAFEAEYNCEIVNTYMDSEEDLLTRLRTSGAGEIDVCLPNCTILPAAIEAGLLEPIDTAKLTNFDSMFERFKTQEECMGADGKMYAVPFVWGSTAISYNTELVPEAPTTIKCLFDEAHAGKIAFRDDYNDAVMAAALALGQDANNPSDLDAIKDLLIQQKALNKTYWQTGDEFSKLFVAGQVEVGLMWSGQSNTMAADGEPIGFVVPEDGAIGWVDNWAIPANSENKDLAYAFIDWMIGKDFQTNNVPANPVNQEAAETVDAEVAKAKGMDEESLNRLVFMQYRDDETKKVWNELWTEVKAA